MLRTHTGRMFIASLNTPAQIPVSTGIDMPKADKQRAKKGVYSVSGVKVADELEDGKLQPGVYVVDGNKILVK